MEPGVLQSGVAAFWQSLDANQRQRARLLVREYQLRPDNEQCIGYHCTSLETTEFLIREGYFPGCPNDESDPNPLLDKRKGDLHFVPKAAAFRGHPLEACCTSERKLKVQIQTYAHSIAMHHYAARALGVDFSESEEYEAAALIDSFDPEGEIARQLFRDRGFTDADMRQIDQDSEARRGVIYLLTPDVKKFILEPGDDQKNGDIRVRLPDRVTINMLCGVWPMGKIERKFFDSLTAFLA